MQKLAKIRKHNVYIWKVAHLFFYVADQSTLLVRSFSWLLTGAEDDWEHLLTSCKKLKSVHQFLQRCRFIWAESVSQTCCVCISSCRLPSILRQWKLFVLTRSYIFLHKHTPDIFLRVELVKSVLKRHITGISTGVSLITCLFTQEVLQLGTFFAGCNMFEC